MNIEQFKKELSLKIDNSLKIFVGYLEKNFGKELASKVDDKVFKDIIELLQKSLMESIGKNLDFSTFNEFFNYYNDLVEKAFINLSVDKSVLSAYNDYLTDSEHTEICKEIFDLNKKDKFLEDKKTDIDKFLNNVKNIFLTKNEKTDKLIKLVTKSNADVSKIKIADSHSATESVLEDVEQAKKEKDNWGMLQFSQGSLKKFLTDIPSRPASAFYKGITFGWKKLGGFLTSKSGLAILGTAAVVGGVSYIASRFTDNTQDNNLKELESLSEPVKKSTQLKDFISVLEKNKLTVTNVKSGIGAHVAGTAVDYGTIDLKSKDDLIGSLIDQEKATGTAALFEFVPSMKDGDVSKFDKMLAEISKKDAKDITEKDIEYINKPDYILNKSEERAVEVIKAKKEGKIKTTVENIQKTKGTAEHVHVPFATKAATGVERDVKNVLKVNEKDPIVEAQTLRLKEAKAKLEAEKKDKPEPKKVDKITYDLPKDSKFLNKKKYKVEGESVYEKEVDGSWGYDSRLDDEFKSEIAKQKIKIEEQSKKLSDFIFELKNKDPHLKERTEYVTKQIQEAFDKKKEAYRQEYSKVLQQNNSQSIPSKVTEQLNYVAKVLEENS